MGNETLYSVLVRLGGEHARILRERKTYGYADLMTYRLSEKSVTAGFFKVVDRGKPTPLAFSAGGVSVSGLDRMPIIGDEERRLRVEDLYETYRTSVPDSHSRFMSPNFPALDPDRMSVRELSEGAPRGTARAALEAWVLCKSLVGDLENLVPPKMFFWRPERHNGLVLFRDWTTKEPSK